MAASSSITGRTTCARTRCWSTNFARSSGASAAGHRRGSPTPSACATPRTSAAPSSSATTRAPPCSIRIAVHRRRESLRRRRIVLPVLGCRESRPHHRGAGDPGSGSHPDQLMRARSFSHVGLTVSDFNRTVKFYWEVFGCPLVGVADTPPERVRTFFGVDAPAPACKSVGFASRAAASSRSSSSSRRSRRFRCRGTASA